jgi:hypothetical protein
MRLRLAHTSSGSALQRLQLTPKPRGKPGSQPPNLQILVQERPVSYQANTGGPRRNPSCDVRPRAAEREGHNGTERSVSDPAPHRKPPAAPAGLAAAHHHPLPATTLRYAVYVPVGRPGVDTDTPRQDNSRGARRDAPPAGAPTPAGKAAAGPAAARAQPATPVNQRKARPGPRGAAQPSHRQAARASPRLHHRQPSRRTAGRGAGRKWQQNIRPAGRPARRPRWETSTHRSRSAHSHKQVRPPLQRLVPDRSNAITCRIKKMTRPIHTQKKKNSDPSTGDFHAPTPKHFRWI